MQRTTIYKHKKYTSTFTSPLWFFVKRSAAVKKAVHVLSRAVVEAAASSWAKCLKKKNKKSYIACVVLGVPTAVCA